MHLLHISLLFLSMWVSSLPLKWCGLVSLQRPQWAEASGLPKVTSKASGEVEREFQTSWEAGAWSSLTNARLCHLQQQFLYPLCLHCTVDQGLAKGQAASVDYHVRPLSKPHHFGIAGCPHEICVSKQETSKWEGREKKVLPVISFGTLSLLQAYLYFRWSFYM